MKLTRSGWIIVLHPTTGEEHSRHAQEREAIESAYTLARELGVETVRIAYDQHVDLTVEDPQTTLVMEEPPVEEPTFSDGFDTFGLSGNEAFDPEVPTLKDGTSITGEARTKLDAAEYWAFRPDPDRYVDIEGQLGSGEAYHTARYGQVCVDPMLSLFRLTGDLRLLDRLCDGYAAMRAAWVVPWNDALYDAGAIEARNNLSMCDLPAGRPPWSPYPKIIRDKSGGTYWATGTDLDDLNQVKLYAAMVEFAWALHENRGKVSPAGYDYDALANTWGKTVEDFVDAWSGPGEECWRTNYNGDDYTTPGRHVRQAFGKYPILTRNESHSAMAGVGLHYYLGRLADTGLWNIQNGAYAREAARAMARDIRNSLVACPAKTGDGLLIPRSNLFTGGSNEALPATYTGYASQYLTKWFLMGVFRDIVTASDMAMLARAYAGMHGPDGSTLGTIAGKGKSCGLDASGGAEKAPYQNALFGYGTMVAFEPEGDDGLDMACTNAQQSSGGGYDTPNTGILPAAQFVGWALRQVGDV